MSVAKLRGRGPSDLERQVARTPVSLRKDRNASWGRSPLFYLRCEEVGSWVVAG